MWGSFENCLPCISCCIPMKGIWSDTIRDTCCECGGKSKASADMYRQERQMVQRARNRKASA